MAKLYVPPIINPFGYVKLHGFHGNPISHIPNRFIYGDFFSHSGGSKE